VNRHLQSPQRLYTINDISVWRTHTTQSMILRSDRFRENFEMGGGKLVWNSLGLNGKIIERLKRVSNRRQWLVWLRSLLLM
jgi:hypothetical protein